MYVDILNHAIIGHHGQLMVTAEYTEHRHADVSWRTGGWPERQGPRQLHFACQHPKNVETVPCVSPRVPTTIHSAVPELISLALRGSDLG